MEITFDVLAVSPHPDDAEIGCGGTLAKLAQAGHKVGIVDLTNGEPTPFNDDPDIRIKEAKNSAKILGIRRITLDLPNRQLMDTIEARIELARIFRQTTPKIVIGMQGMTPGASPDHYQSQLIFDAAIFYSRLTKWEHLFNGLKPWRIEHAYYYYTARELTQINHPTQFISDISSFFETKKKSLLCYQSQFKAHSSYNPPIVDWIEGMGQYFGSLAGFKYGEIFFGMKILNIDIFEHFLQQD
ncbi:MAG: LmbE family protein [Candidatus Heimdallarchaeota archaeon]|nr:LmbE family protein [Candidatus Heimdallarchaeota archaeon]